MAAAQLIAEYLRRIGQLKMKRDGVGAFEQVSVQAEIFRLSGIVQGILASEGDPIWAELEPLGIVKQVLEEELEETWKQLKEMRIPKLTSGSGHGTKDPGLAEFPRYLELPGPVVRKMILSYLTDPKDELSVAKAIPSEVEYLSGPLNLIKLKAVFPILMEKKLLEPLDLMNLSAADPYIHGFIRKYFESVLCKDADYLKSKENWMALEQVPVTGNLTVLPLVVIKEFNNATWDKLRICGSQMLHCCILLVEGQEAERHRLLCWLKSYLELLPNLTTLSIVAHYSFSEEEDLTLATPPRNPDLFPELPFLKNLVLHLNMFGFLSQPLLEEYGGQLQMLHLCPIKDPQFPISWTCLSSLSLEYYPGDDRSTMEWNGMETLLNLLNKTAHCPLKVLNVVINPFWDCPPIQLQQLVMLISNNWGESLECLQLNMSQFEGFTWTGITHNLGFPKLKQFTWENYYLYFISWDFLFCCPGLEKFSSIQCSNLSSNMQQGVDVSSLIEVCHDRERMLRSNIWKFFPKLEQVLYNKWKEEARGSYRSHKFGVTRKECVAYKNR